MRIEGVGIVLIWIRGGPNQALSAHHTRINGQELNLMTSTSLKLIQFISSFTATVFALSLSVFSTTVFSADDLQCDRLFVESLKRDTCISLLINSGGLKDDALNSAVAKKLADDNAKIDQDQRSEIIKNSLSAEAKKSGSLQIKLLTPGMALKVVQELYPFLTCGRAPDKSDFTECFYSPSSALSQKQKHAELESIAENPVSIWTLTFTATGKLSYASVLMNSDGFDDVAKALTAKFGRASASSTKNFQNGFGARFSGRTLSWKQRDSALEIHQFSTNRETMSLTISSLSALRDIEKRSLMNSKRGAKDL
jgi:hypothetical protein